MSSQVDTFMSVEEQFRRVVSEWTLFFQVSGNKNPRKDAVDYLVVKYPLEVLEYLRKYPISTDP